MVTRSSGLCWRSTIESETGQIQFINEQINHSDWVVFINIVVQTIRQQRYLVTTFA